MPAKGGAGKHSHAGLIQQVFGQFDGCPAIGPNVRERIERTAGHLTAYAGDGIQPPHDQVPTIPKLLHDLIDTCLTAQHGFESGMLCKSGRATYSVGEQQVTLRAREFDLLLTMAQHKGIVLSREKLLDLVWGFDFPGQTRTVDVHVAHLRDKLKHSQVEIETVWGVGYKLAG